MPLKNFYVNGRKNSPRFKAALRCYNLRGGTRFSKGNMVANQALLDLLKKFANDKGKTPAQISLAWMMCKNNFVVPIPGMRRDERLKENFDAANVTLDKSELAELEDALAKVKIHGDRKNSDIQKLGTVKTAVATH